MMHQYLINGLLPCESLSNHFLDPSIFLIILMSFVQI